MGFAKYFERDIVALNKRLSKTGDANFREILQTQTVCIEVDAQFSQSKEAEVCIELLVRLISRFYPKVKFLSHTKFETDKLAELQALARSINSNIEFATDDEAPTVTISAACVAPRSGSELCFFVGSDDWLAKYSVTSAQTFGDSGNPFGASIAACIAAANVFRFVFEKQLKRPLDSEILFSVLDFVNAHNSNVSLTDVKLDDVNLIGVGAIGSAAVWALSKLPSLSGKITLIDHDRVQESNLHRYILMSEQDVGESKVSLSKNILSRNGLEVEIVNDSWENFVHTKYNGICRCRLAAVSIDSKDGRVLIQASLPKEVINAYTDESRFGVSRHTDFASKVCLACLYLPEYQEKGRLQTIAEELNMKGSEKFLYQYMRSDKQIDDAFLDLFSRQNEIDVALLQEYKSKSLGDFYLHMVCGYGLIKIAGENRRAEFVDVPLSFQSAMSGILFAAEIVAESSGASRANPNTVSQWQVLDEINGENPSHYQYLKNKPGNCICGDEIYIKTYLDKWKQI